MEIEKIIEFIQKETPAHGKELWEAVGALTEVFDNTYETIRKLMMNYMDKQDDKKSDEFYAMSKEIGKVSKFITDLSDKYCFIEDEKDGEIAIDEDIEEEVEVEGPEDTRGKINYDEYRVDDTIEHSLYSDFKNTKPAAYLLNGVRYEIRSWYKMTLAVCELLYKRDSKRFEKVVREYSIKGRKKAYIAFENDSIASTIINPIRLMNTEIVIEQVLNSNQHRDIIAKLLEKNGTPRSAFKIYLRTDTKELHKKTESDDFKGESVEKNDCNLGEELKIGKQAKKYFEQFFSDTRKTYDISKFLNKYWCSENLGICYPL